MDNHPIPQDITGFKFKLIGSMTIRQFIYLAIGAIFAWFWFFIVEPPAIVKWPVSFISLSIGAIVAFVPIDGRPMDTMMRNFFTALTSPTQFVYQKESGTSGNNQNQNQSYGPSTRPVAQATFQQASPQPASPPQVTPQAQPALAPPPAQKPAAPPPVLFPEEEKTKQIEPEPNLNQVNEAAPNILADEKEEMKRQIAELQKKLEEKEAQAKTITPEPTTQAQTPQVDQGVAASQQELSEAQRQKEALEKQILEMQAKQDIEKNQKFEPVTATPIQQTQNVRRLPADMSSSAGYGEAPDAPNLIVGIVKDPRGNPLQNILVEVLDTDGNPVRAFKTNKLGKFASATSLSNGSYIVKFEDSGEKHKFDTIQMDLTGTNVLPLEVISVDPREELRRELFN